MLPYEMRPWEIWTDVQTPAMQRDSGYRFKATEAATWRLLSHELEMLGVKSYVVEVDIDPRHLRVDGKPRANAILGTHPGVIVSFESKHGPLRYATDTFATWQANLRAIALALEALRKVDRYGVGQRGEQYKGWTAIEAPQPEFADALAAARWMVAFATDELDLRLNGPTPVLDVWKLAPHGWPTVKGWNGLFRAMAALMHPDRGWPRADWDRLSEAKRMLAKAGWINNGGLEL